MSLVDAHHHVWCPESRDPDLGYGWLRDRGARKPFGDPTPIQRDYLWPEYLREIDPPPAASVHVQADAAADPAGEVDWAARTARAAGHRVAVVGLADLAAPDLAARLARLRATPELRGVRQIVARDPDRPALSFAPRDLLADPDWRRGLAVVAEAGLSFDLQLYAHQAGAALAALGPHPGLAVVVDHALSPVDGPTPAWRAAVEALAARPGTAIKLSGWGMVDPRWTAETVAPMVEAILRAFGPERTMWGSNVPVESLARPLAHVVRDTRAALRLAGCDDAAERAVMADAARRFYRLAA